MKQDINDNNNLMQSNPNQMNDPDKLDGGGGFFSWNSPKKPNIFTVLAVIFLINFLLNLFVVTRLPGDYRIEYGQFIQLVEQGHVSQVQINEDNLRIRLNDNAVLTQIEAIIYPNGTPADEARRQALSVDSILVAIRVDDPSLVDRLSDNNIGFYRQLPATRSPILGFIFSWVVPILIMYLLFMFLGRKLMEKMGGGMMSVGKSKAKEYTAEKNIGVKFAHVAGCDEAKESLAELADYLKNPGKYQKIGAKQPKGALLVGPPGTGKTLLAKALAGEAGVSFFSISGSEFVEMYVGVGASRVRDLFEQAKKNAPCIIFIDEIDAIGKSRDNQMVGNDEREQTLNQLLTEMDGFSTEKGIVVLAATNRPEVLDKALLRPGRFDRRVIVEKPDLMGREAILKVHVSNIKLDENVNLHELALATSGATGADLANMVNEGALIAVKDNREKVTQKDIMDAIEIVIAGKEKKDRVMNQNERRMVAYHEVGHALVSALQKNCQPVQKITIVPRTMGSLGYVMNMPEEERYLMTKSEMLAQITSLLGGRAAEIIQFGEVTTGASNDIERATSLARGMVSQYGMSDTLGPVSLANVQNRYLDGQAVKNCSSETETLLDNEVRQILFDCQSKANELLNENRGALDKISEYLIENENITGEQFMKLLNNGGINDSKGLVR